MNELPEGWVHAPLASLSRTIDYGFTASAEAANVGPKLLRITDLQDQRVDWATVPHCRCPDPEGNLLQPGDIVVARTGATTGKSFLVLDVPEPAVFASYLIRIRTGEAIEPRYLATFMQSPDYWAQITTVSKGTAQPGANATVLGGLDVPIAPLAEQRRIVARLEDLLARSRRAKDALDAIPPLLERLRQSILAAAFRGDLTRDWREQHPDVEPAEKLLARVRTERRKNWEEAEFAKLRAKGKPQTDDRWKAKYKEPEPVDTEGLPELPEGWCWASVDELSTKVVDGVHKKPEYVPSGVPFLTVRNLTAGPGISFAETSFVTEADHLEYFRRANPEKGDILITKDGTLGVTRLIETDAVFSIFVSLALVKPVLPDMGRYLETAFQAPHFQGSVTHTGTGLQHIHLGDLRVAALPIAPLAEQIAICSRVGELLNCVVRLQHDTVDAKTRFQLLEASALAKAFRGELVSQDPNDEPAAAMLARLASSPESSEQLRSAKNGRKPRRSA